VINAPAVSTVAPIVHRLVVYESFKVFVDEVTDTDLLGVLVDDLAPRVLRENALEAGGAVTVVLSITPARIWPVLAVGAPLASTV